MVMFLMPWRGIEGERVEFEPVLTHGRTDSTSFVILLISNRNQYHDQYRGSVSSCKSTHSYDMYRSFDASMHHHNYSASPTLYAHLCYLSHIVYTPSTVCVAFIQPFFVDHIHSFCDCFILASCLSDFKFLFIYYHPHNGQGKSKFGLL